MQVASFYHFFDFTEAAAMKKPLGEFLCRNGIKGTILLAPEGINGTISGTEAGVAKVIALLRALAGIGELEVKYSTCDEHPFRRAKVKLKREIIAFGRACDPAHKTAQLLGVDAWNKLLSDPETILLDTRNDYEVEHGTFAGAVNPNISHFRDLPAYIEAHLADAKDKPIATFCTGGVRCEKLTSWMMEQGFTRLYQLDGGIIKYMEHCPQEKSRWQGECFVFDERIALDHELDPVGDKHNI